MIRILHRGSSLSYLSLSIRSDASCFLFTENVGAGLDAVSFWPSSSR